MNILKLIVNSASNGFGREFGRAGANKILRGSNSYNVNMNNYSGRIKPSDSDRVKAIKELGKVTFSTSNKGNVSKLITLTDLVISNLEFDGLDNQSEVEDMLSLYIDKYEHGCAMIDDDFEGESVDYLNLRREKFYVASKAFEVKLKQTVNFIFRKHEKKRTTKKGVIFRNVLGSLLFLWTVFVPIFLIYNIYRVSKNTQDEFDTRYNVDYIYYRNLKINLEG